MSLRNLLDDLRKEESFIKNVTSWSVIPPREGVFADIPSDMADILRQTLADRGITRLYSHQAESWRLIREGRDIVVVTPTASGKTLCYNLPVLQGLMEDPAARALYLFPTKALSQDQQSALNEILLGGQLGIPVYTFDGDTPSSIRIAARQGGRIIISNPDMLHTGVLPNHTKWIMFFQSIKYIILDELHTYNGIFGAHMANLMRRFLRLCRFYGSNPMVIAASATIGNPTALAERLLDRPFKAIDSNGAPAGEKASHTLQSPLSGCHSGNTPRNRARIPASRRPATTGRCQNHRLHPEQNQCRTHLLLHKQPSRQYLQRERGDTGRILQGRIPPLGKEDDRSRTQGRRYTGCCVNKCLGTRH